MGKITLTVQRLKGSRGSSRRSSSQSAGGLKKSDSGVSSKSKGKHSKSKFIFRHFQSVYKRKGYSVSSSTQQEKLTHFVVIIGMYTYYYNKVNHFLPFYCMKMGGFKGISFTF